MEPLLVFSVLFVLVGLTWFWWRHARVRAARARIEPVAHLRLLPADELRARIVRFLREHPALDVFEEESHLHVTWQIHPVRVDAEPPIEQTHSLELRFRPPETVEVRYGMGRVNWTHSEDRTMYEPVVEWDWDATPDFGNETLAGTAPPDPTGHSPHSVDGLVQPLRTIALKAGWAWQPVLEVPAEEDGDVEQGVASP